MTAKVIFSFSHCSSLYTAFAALTVYRELDTVLITIRIIISGVIIAVIITFIHQLRSSSDSNLNFALTI